MVPLNHNEGLCAPSDVSPWSLCSVFLVVMCQPIVCKTEMQVLHVYVLWTGLCE